MSPNFIWILTVAANANHEIDDITDIRETHATALKCTSLLMDLAIWAPDLTIDQTLNTNLELLSNADVKTRINFTSISFLSYHITFNSIFMILNKENKIKDLL